MARTIKPVVFAALLACAGCFLGLVLRWIGNTFEVAIPTSWDAVYLGIWFLAAAVTVAVTGGLVAVLLRPFWVAVVAFAVSALALFLTWEISAVSIVVAAAYFLAGLLYLLGVRSEIGNRIRFSVWHLMRAQGILLVALVAIACASLYFGYAAQIEREGFSIPQAAVDGIVEAVDEHMDSLVPEGTLSPGERQEILDQLRQTLEGEVGSAAQPYADYIPIGLAVIAFIVLVPVMFLLSWIPILILSPLLFILTRSGVVKKVTELVEVTRLSLEES